MKPYITTIRNNFCILDLSYTHTGMKQGFTYLSKVLLSKKKILFVGGPKGMEKPFFSLCRKYGHLYIDSYTDGTFTNFQLKKASRDTSIHDCLALVFFFDLSVKDRTIKELMNLNIPTMAFVSSEDNTVCLDYLIPANIKGLKGSIFVYNLFYHFFSITTKN